jgi:ABC-type sulfate/molybdate transport systems ATPase subunit
MDERRLHQQRLDDISKDIREAEVAALLLDSGLLSSQKEMFSRKTTQILNKQRLDDIPKDIREAEVAALLLDSGLLSSQKEMFS